MYSRRYYNYNFKFAWLNYYKVKMYKEKNQCFKIIFSKRL